MIGQILPYVVAGLIPLGMLAGDVAARPVPITQAELARWIVDASHKAAVEHGQTNGLPQDVADAMAAAAISNPLIAGDNRSLQALASLEVSIAWFETGGQLILNPKGSNDHNASACWSQIYLPGNAHTAEGWSRDDLRHDPLKCATAAVRIIKASLAGAPSCGYCGLTLFARGHDTAEGRELSRHRVRLAERLLRDVPLQRTVSP